MSRWGRGRKVFYSVLRVALEIENFDAIIRLVKWGCHRKGILKVPWRTLVNVFHSASVLVSNRNQALTRNSGPECRETSFLSSGPCWSLGERQLYIFNTPTRHLGVNLKWWKLLKSKPSNDTKKVINWQTENLVDHTNIAWKCVFAFHGKRKP